jgi:hypothetical protein
VRFGIAPDENFGYFVLGFEIVIREAVRDLKAGMKTGVTDSDPAGVLVRFTNFELKISTLPVGIENFVSRYC